MHSTPPQQQESVQERLHRLGDVLVPSLDLEFEERGRKMKRRFQESPIGPDYFARMYSSGEYHASDCIQRLSRGSGLRHELEGCSGTMIKSLKISREKLDVVWDEIRGDLDGAWSHVALEDGVRQARAGKHDEAVVSYHQALKLNPKNIDAYVAKGAALANKGQYLEAMAEFDRALELDPMDRNALEYQERTNKYIKDRTHKTERLDTKPELQYREDLFGRSQQNPQPKQGPDRGDVEHALSVLSKKHKQEEKKKRKKKKSKKDKGL